MIDINPVPRRRDSELRIGADSNLLLDGGVNLKYDPTQLRDNQSPIMVNMTTDDRGALNKRDGQDWMFPSSIGAGGINGAYQRLFMGFRVFSWGTGIFRQSGISAPTSIMTGLANSKGCFFPFNGKLYYINGTNYVVIDSSFIASNVVGYMPTLVISSPPAGGGTTFEQFNLLAPGFKASFSGNATATVYQLPLTGLDATAVTATVNGVAKVETTDFTVNRSTGTVTFLVAPSNGTNNVVITAYKTVSGNADRIRNCRYMIDYGGDNDTRLFWWGNGNYKNRVFRSGLNDPTYAPENEYSDVGSSSEAVTACAKHYGNLVYLKEYSLYFTTYTNPVTQGFWGASQIGASFPLYPINAAVGCDMPDSVQIIENNIVFFNSETGGYILVSTQLRDERNVRPISGNINGSTIRPGLMSNTKASLQAASSVDDGSNYWLCVGDKAYVWNYSLSPFVNTGDSATDEERLSWMYHTNINASCWVSYDRSLYYGSRSMGQMVMFQANYNDFGTAINGVWRSKLWSFNFPDWYKTISKVWFTSKAGGYSTVTIKYISEEGEILDQEDINVNSFRWDLGAWDTWTWAVNEYPPPTKLKPNIKKVVYFQIEFSNNRLNENLSLMSLVVQHMVVKKVK